MSRQLLESICEEVDKIVMKKEGTDLDLLLKNIIPSDDNKSKIYSGFAHHYYVIKEVHQNQIESLEKDKPEIKMKYSNAFMGGFVGSVVADLTVKKGELLDFSKVALAGIGIGLCYDMYNKIAKKDITPKYIFSPLILGYIIGNHFGNNNTENTLIGAGIGLLVGIGIDIYKSKNAPGFDADYILDLERNDERYVTEKNRLIESTVEKLG